jgi:hypothetical protein
LNFFKEILKYIHHYQLKIKFKIASYFIWECHQFYFYF